MNYNKGLKLIKQNEQNKKVETEALKKHKQHQKTFNSAINYLKSNNYNVRKMPKTNLYHVTNSYSGENIKVNKRTIVDHYKNNKGN